MGARKIGIICNTANADFKAYFLALYRGLPKEYFVFLGNSKLRAPGIMVGSYTKIAFLDPRGIIDFFYGLYRIPKLRLQGVRTLHFISAHSSNLIYAFYASLLGMRLVFTIHDVVPHPDFKSKFIAAYNKLIIWWSDYIIVHNHRYKQLLNDSKVHYFPLSGFRANIIERVPDKMLLFFGRIEPYKGLANLYEIALIMKKQLPEWQIVVAGKGNIPSMPTAWPNNVTLMNRFIEDSELKELFVKACFTVLPYDSASQSGVIIQSYSYGVPVLAYDVGALGDYIIHGKTGFLVGHRNNSDLVSIIQTQSAMDYEEMETHIEDVFLSEYSEEAFCRYSMEFYNKIDN